MSSGSLVTVIHTINTRRNSNLYVPAANLTLYEKGFYYSGIKIFNHLPTTIKNLLDDKNKFQIALKKFLLIHSTAWRNTLTHNKQQ